MRKLSELTPNPSEMSLTPHSSHQQPKLSDLSMQQYEFEMRTDFTRKNKNKFGNGHDRGMPMLHEHVDLKDMMTSAYDHTARVSVILIILGAAIGVGLG